MLRLHETTSVFIANYAKALPHAILLVGQKGSGLATLARHLADENGKLITIVSPQAKTSTSVPSISAERIRDLYVETRTKLPGANFVIIDDADAMNHVAQNALLKLLEEPNESIHFILTSHFPDKLLPTIRSRVQTHVVAPISEVESKRLLTALGITDELDVRRLLYVATGLPAELSRLAEDKTAFRMVADQVAVARQFVEGNTYQKLIVVQSLKDDRQGALVLIEMILLLLRRTIATNPQVTSITLIDKLTKASEAIRANGNIRLHLMRAVV